jgi:hypothetical protein
VLRGIFGQNRNGIIGCWRISHSIEFHNLYFSPNIKFLMKIGWAWHVTRMRAKRNASIVLLGSPEGKRILRRSRRR